MASSTYKGFKVDDKLTDKSDYHEWKMSLDLVLEDQDVMDYVQAITEGRNPIKDKWPPQPTRVSRLTIN